MHEAYECIPILEKLPLNIESVATFDDRVVVGTRQGHLLLYKLRTVPGPLHCDVQLLRSNKNFSRKPIVQIDVVPEFQTLISLSDGLITAHDLAAFNFNLFASVPKAKGASMFQLDVQRHTSLTGEPSVTVRLCVAVRRKLHLLYWKNREFHELTTDLTLPDVPRSLAWGRQSICVGLRNEYYLLQLSGEGKELFPTGKSGEPHIAYMGNDRLVLLRDHQSIFIDSDGVVTHKSAVTWTHLPLAVSYDAPYLIALCPNHVEVRTVEPRLHIQTIEWPSPKLIRHHGTGQIIVASSNDLWLLKAVPVSDQINSLVQDKHFQLALHLADLSEEPEEARRKQHQHIQNLHAFDMFTKKQFKEAMQIFIGLNTDPSHVIGLFPDLLPKEYWNQLEYPDTLPILQGRDIENGLLALADFLTQVRHNLMKEPSESSVSNMAIVEGSGTVRSRLQLLQIVDTTLLKCYLQTNSALVASLLRLKDNYCHLGETEYALKRDHKYSELIILYQTRNLHRNALEMLQKHSRRTDTPLHGNHRLINYLQHLGYEHLDLILEFARPVLETSPEEGLLIFTDDIHEVEGLPRHTICEFLRSVTPRMLLPYLEHVVETWKDPHPMFHNELICQYRARVQELSQSDVEYGQYQRQLIQFLQHSEHYIPEQIIVHFPHNAFYEERAVLLGRLGRHEQALTIYVHVMQDLGKALEYCRQHYSSEYSADDKVYLSLFGQLTATACPRQLGVQTASKETSKGPDLPAALALLHQHGDKIDFVEAVLLLPAELRLGELWGFLQSTVRRTETARRAAQLVLALQWRQSVNSRADRMLHQAQRLQISDTSFCSICKKRFSGQSVLARLPGDDVIHYACQTSANTT